VRRCNLLPGFVVSVSVSVVQNHFCGGSICRDLGVLLLNTHQNPRICVRMLCVTSCVDNILKIKQSSSCGIKTTIMRLKKFCSDFNVELSDKFQRFTGIFILSSNRPTNRIE
jgi:hypothetical protein